MTFVIEEATRESVKLKIGLSGVSGAGKTMGALRMAHGICNDWGRVVIADTENNSASNYVNMADIGQFKKIELAPPYHPQRFVELIQQCAADPSIDVLIIDSASAEWEGEGGCLSIVEELKKGVKNEYTVWGRVTPMHKAFVTAFLQSNLHIIMTLRKKSDVVMEKDHRGKLAPRKVGLKDIQREGLEYEFSIAFDLDRDSHLASVTKDRTNQFNGIDAFNIDASIGVKLINWTREGIYTGSHNQKLDLLNTGRKMGLPDEVIIKIHLDLLTKPIGQMVALLSKAAEPKTIKEANEKLSQKV